MPAATGDLMGTDPEVLPAEGDLLGVDADVTPVDAEVTPVDTDVTTPPEVDLLGVEEPAEASREVPEGDLLGVNADVTPVEADVEVPPIEVNAVEEAPKPKSEKKGGFRGLFGVKKAKESKAEEVAVDVPEVAPVDADTEMKVDDVSPDVDVTPPAAPEVATDEAATREIQLDGMDVDDTPPAADVDIGEPDVKMDVDVPEAPEAPPADDVVGERSMEMDVEGGTKEEEDGEDGGVSKVGLVVGGAALAGAAAVGVGMATSGADEEQEE